MELFGPLLAGLLRERRQSQRQFARLVGVHHTHVNKIIHGTRQPYWRRADHWAEALGLSGAAAEEFKDAMHLASASPRVRALVDRLMKSHQTFNRRSD